MSQGNTLLGFLAGGAIGAIAGILFAPDKGSATREKLTNEAQHVKDELEQRLADLETQVKDTVENKSKDFKSRMDEVVSDSSVKAEEAIEYLEEKLATLKAKNKKFQKQQG